MRVPKKQSYGAQQLVIVLKARSYGIPPACTTGQVLLLVLSKSKSTQYTAARLHLMFEIQNLKLMYTYANACASVALFYTCYVCT